MLQGIFALAVVIGGVAALMGSRTALVLLAGTFLELVLEVSGVGFRWWLWAGVDVCVAIVIACLGLTPKNRLIIALFAPAIACYFVDGWGGYAGSVAVCSAQFLLSFPWLRAWRRVRHAKLTFDPFRDFDLKVEHAG